MSLVVSGLSVSKSGKAIVSDIAFTAPTGAITGIIGPNGAGKSTVLSAMLGLLTATGSARFEDRELPTMPRRERARMVALVEQSASTEERLLVRDVVALGRIPHEAAWQAAPSPEDAGIIAMALHETGMTAFADRRFDTLSGGEQQRVHMARALAQQPRLLLLDEPTSHLDIAAQLQLLALLKRKSASGMTVLLVLHDLNLAARYCEHFVLLSQGRLAAEGRPDEVLTPARLQEIYGVNARLVRDPQAGRPLIVYDDADAFPPHQIPD
ncbi:iron complex transport system ATP-binding protein [Devosia lucknowensis]|uniref:Iron complex transport system ATP-binding protein n=1 Tax=Devosia lucknowensis TaxID=1096929 RepID=A0A1Y6FH48_9HYPH|nr:ABC transporter ATP-binding protein [Devosia lucknowensis]SMQ72881.1 iron complex transport system ATP-binding protein [Devosia lucknowensis]